MYLRPGGAPGYDSAELACLAADAPSPASCHTDPAASPTTRPFEGGLRPPSSQSGVRWPCRKQNRCLELVMQRKEKSSTWMVCWGQLTQPSPGSRGGGSWSSCIVSSQPGPRCLPRRMREPTSAGVTQPLAGHLSTRSNRTAVGSGLGAKALVTRQARNEARWS